MPVTAFAQKQFFFKGWQVCSSTVYRFALDAGFCKRVPKRQLLSVLSWQPNIRDIAILSGDVVTDDPAMDGWKSVVDIFNEAKMPFVVMMGNHDAEYLYAQ